MIRTRRAALAQSGTGFRLEQTRSVRREIIHKDISDPIQSNRIMIYCARATRNSSIRRLLVPATERTTDLIVVLLHTCRRKTEREEENAGLVGYP